MITLICGVMNSIYHLVIASKHVMATQIFRMSQIAAILTAAKIQVQTLNKIGVVITRT
jgi:hypothetical protein